MNVTIDKWKYTAATLGLELYGAARDYSNGLSFDAIASATEEPIESPNPRDTNMRGRWRVAAAGRTLDVVVMRQVVNLEKHSHFYTRVVARIERPLFVGLVMRSPRPMDPLFGEGNPVSGVQEIDGRFSFAAAYPAEAHAILRRAMASPNDVVDHLLAASGGRFTEVMLTDTTVELQTPFTADPAAIAPLLDSAAALALVLSERRPELPRNPAESLVVEALRGFASSARLTFDADRLAVHGHRGTVAVAVRTACGEGAFFTALALVPARPHNRGLRLTRQGTFQFVASFFGSQDVTVGDAEFDETFVVKGRDKQEVQAFLGAHPDARRALCALARVADVKVTDRGLTVDWRTVLGEGELTALANQLPSLVGLFDPDAAATPYR
jgi:hypothetical protein